MFEKKSKKSIPVREIQDRCIKVVKNSRYVAIEIGKRESISREEIADRAESVSATVAAALMSSFPELDTMDFLAAVTPTEDEYKGAERPSKGKDRDAKGDEAGEWI